MPLRVVYDFLEAGEGWSEVYWTNDTAPSDYIAIDTDGTVSSTTKAGIFIAVRTAILNTFTQILRVRVSQVGMPRVVIPAPVQPAQGTGTFIYGSSGKPPGGAQTYAKLLMFMSSGATRRRSMWLGGIPEIIIEDPQTYKPTSRWNSALLNYQMELRKNYGIVGRPAPTGGTPAVPILTFVVDPQVAVTATATPSVAAPVGTPTSWLVILRGIKAPRGWNGVHRAQAGTTSGTIVIGPTRKSQVSEPAYAPNTGATIQAFAPTFAQFDSVVPVRVSKRKTGRPFGLPAGRRS